jgi:hypothetical protein
LLAAGGWTSGVGGSELIRTGREGSARCWRPPSSMRVRRGLRGRGGVRVGMIGIDDTSTPWVLPTRKRQTSSLMCAGRGATYRPLVSPSMSGLAGASGGAGAA